MFKTITSNPSFLKNKKIFVAKKILIITFFKLISVLSISKLVLSAHIYLPGLYWIAQTSSNELSAVFSSETVNLSPFDFQNLFFFLFAVLIDFGLIIFTYFYFSKNYAKLSLYATLIWLVFGIVVSLKTVQNWTAFTFLDFNVQPDGYQRTKNFSFYFIAFLAGFISGFTDSFIWKQNCSAGGLDYIFTYFASRKKKQLSRPALLIVFFFVTISILINEVGNPSFSFPIFLYLLFSSLIFNQTRIFLINTLYPKYKLVKIFIITQKGKLIRQELAKFYSHGGNILKTKGFYDQKEKEIITTVTNYLEKNLLLTKLKKIDPDIFFIGVPVDFLEGHFLFNDD